MGLMRNVRKLASKENIDRARDLAAQNADKITGTVSKATDAIDKRTGGRYRDKLDQVEGTVARNLEKAKGDGEGPQEGHRPDPDPGR